MFSVLSGAGKYFSCKRARGVVLNCRPERSPERWVNKQLAQGLKETVAELSRICTTWDSLAADPF